MKVRYFPHLLSNRMSGTSSFVGPPKPTTLYVDASQEVMAQLAELLGSREVRVAQYAPEEGVKEQDNGRLCIYIERMSDGKNEGGENEPPPKSSEALKGVREVLRASSLKSHRNSIIFSMGAKVADINVPGKDVCLFGGKFRIYPAFVHVFHQLSNREWTLRPYLVHPVLNHGDDPAVDIGRVHFVLALELKPRSKTDRFVASALADSYGSVLSHIGQLAAVVVNGDEELREYESLALRFLKLLLRELAFVMERDRSGSQAGIGLVFPGPRVGDTHEHRIQAAGTDLLLASRFSNSISDLYPDPKANKPGRIATPPEGEDPEKYAWIRESGQKGFGVYFERAEKLFHDPVAAGTGTRELALHAVFFRLVDQSVDSSWTEENASLSIRFNPLRQGNLSLDQWILAMALNRSLEEAVPKPDDPSKPITGFRFASLTNLRLGKDDHGRTESDLGVLGILMENDPESHPDIDNIYKTILDQARNLYRDVHSLALKLRLQETNQKLMAAKVFLNSVAHHQGRMLNLWHSPRAALQALNRRELGYIRQKWEEIQGEGREWDLWGEETGKDVHLVSHGELLKYKEDDFAVISRFMNTMKRRLSFIADFGVSIDHANSTTANFIRDVLLPFLQHRVMWRGLCEGTDIGFTIVHTTSGWESRSHVLEPNEEDDDVARRPLPPDFPDFAMALPRGPVGAQALYILLENIVVNFHRHNRDAEERPRNPLMIEIHIRPVEGSSRVSVEVSDPTGYGDLSRIEQLSNPQLGTFEEGWQEGQGLKEMWLAAKYLTLSSIHDSIPAIHHKRQGDDLKAEARAESGERFDLVVSERERVTIKDRELAFGIRWQFDVLRSFRLAVVKELGADLKTIRTARLLVETETPIAPIQASPPIVWRHMGPSWARFGWRVLEEPGWTLPADNLKARKDYQDNEKGISLRIEWLDRILRCSGCERRVYWLEDSLGEDQELATRLEKAFNKLIPPGSNAERLCLRVRNVASPEMAGHFCYAHHSERFRTIVPVAKDGRWLGVGHRDGPMRLFDGLRNLQGASLVSASLDLVEIMLATIVVCMPSLTELKFRGLAKDAPERAAYLDRCEKCGVLVLPEIGEVIDRIAEIAATAPMPPILLIEQSQLDKYQRDLELGNIDNIPKERLMAQRALDAFIRADLLSLAAGVVVTSHKNDPEQRPKGSTVFTPSANVYAALLEDFDKGLLYRVLTGTRNEVGP